jgi:outer membrane lipoprotein-sorting protein
LIAFILNLSLSCVVAAADVGECYSSIILDRIRHYVESIEDYQLQSNVILDGRQVTSEISGKPPILMRIKMHIKQGDTIVNLTVTFDENYQWIETKTPSVTEVLKIKLAGLVSPGRPFDTSYYLMGSGILNGEDYPSSITTLLSIYDLKANCTENEIQLSGPLNIEKFTQYSSTKKSSDSLQSRIKKYSKNFNQLTMVFDTKSLALNEYYLGTKDKPTKFAVTFHKLRINQKLTAKDIAYIPPKGVQAIDITADLIEHLENQ